MLASSNSHTVKTIQSAYDNSSGGWNMPDTWHVCGLRQSCMQRSGGRSGRINKVHGIWDLWWRPIDQLEADCLRHSGMPMRIITKSEVRQNYCITEDELQHCSLTVTVTPFQWLISVHEDKLSVTECVCWQRQSLCLVSRTKEAKICFM